MTTEQIGTHVRTTEDKPLKVKNLEKESISSDDVHERAIGLMVSLKGLSKGDKRRVIKRAEKILDA